MVLLPFLPLFLSLPPSIPFFISSSFCLSLSSFSLFPEPWLLSHDTASLLPDYVNIRQPVLCPSVKHLLQTVFSLTFNSSRVVGVRGTERPRHQGREGQKLLFGNVIAPPPHPSHQSPFQIWNYFHAAEEGQVVELFLPASSNPLPSPPHLSPPRPPTQHRNPEHSQLKERDR